MIASTEESNRLEHNGSAGNERQSVAYWATECFWLPSIRMLSISRWTFIAARVMIRHLAPTLDATSATQRRPKEAAKSADSTWLCKSSWRQKSSFCLIVVFRFFPARKEAKIRSKNFIDSICLSLFSISIWPWPGCCCLSSVAVAAIDVSGAAEKKASNWRRLSEKMNN